MALLRCALLLSIAVATAAAGAQDTPVAAPALPPLVEHHCAECHRGADAEQGFDVDLLFANGASAELRSHAADALLRLRSRTMPPQDAADPAPNAEQRQVLAETFAALLPDDPDARTVVMRRLSRTEYEHTVRDLCGVAFAAADLLPEDPRAHGCDNLGDVMTVSPLVFEACYQAAGVVAAAMVADPAALARAFADDQPPATTLGPFLGRAFRRPVADDEVRERTALYDRLLAEGLPVTAARAAVLQSILASPSFLFRVENGCAAAPEQLSLHELAVRASYLVSASLPDGELRAHADAGDLAEPAVLAAEVLRLLKATGGRPLADGFAAQWLRFADVRTASADFRRYPQIWNGSLRPAFYEEAALLFAEIVREDLSVLTLLDCDHTWLDETLSKVYGFGDAKGGTFVRTAVPDRRRGGLLGMGAMLMVTSYPLRTSPVLRGRWILEQLLDEPPPPPPANAGKLPADDEQPDKLTLRARLEAHRQQKSCANCHATMDPLGFALENFDVLGRWRDEAQGQPIDCRAELPDGTVLDGPIALKDALLERKRDFVRAMTKQLLVRAIGRPLVPADERELLRLVDVTAAGDYRFSAMLAAVVTSPLFTQRTAGGTR